MKVVLTTITNGNSLSAINSNFTKLRDELQDKVLYRNNPVGEPNALVTDIDANGQDIYNVNELRAVEVYVDGKTIEELTEGVSASIIAQAEAARDAAELSEDNAAASASGAAVSASNALASANAADASADEAAVQAAIATAAAGSIADGPVASFNGRTGIVVSSPLDKAGLALVKGDVGLNNVDNTTDLTKPISTATQTALNGKEPTIATGTTAQYVRGDKSLATLDKTAVGLANVDNTSDANKPVSTATNTLLVTGAWPAMTVNLSTTAGSLSSASGVAWNRKVGRTVEFTMTLTVTSVGTGSGVFRCGIPYTAAHNCAFVGREDSATGALVQAQLKAGDNFFSIYSATNTFPAANNTSFIFSGVFEATA